MNYDEQKDIEAEGQRAAIYHTRKREEAYVMNGSRFDALKEDVKVVETTLKQHGLHTSAEAVRRLRVSATSTRTTASLLYRENMALRNELERLGHRLKDPAAGDPLA